MVEKTKEDIREVKSPKKKGGNYNYGQLKFLIFYINIFIS